MLPVEEELKKLEALMEEFFETHSYDETPGDWRVMPETAEDPDDDPLWQEPELEDGEYVQKDAAFEAKHPRHPPGSELGGQFASRDSAVGGAGEGKGPIDWDKVKSSSEVDRLLSAKYPGIKFGFYGMLEEPAIAFGREFERMADTYPFALAELQYVGLESSSHHKATDINRDKSWAYQNDSMKVINFVDRHFTNLRNYALLQRDVLNCERNGFHSSGSGDVASLLTHEFGHVVDSAIRHLQVPFELRRRSDDIVVGGYNSLGGYWYSRFRTSFQKYLEGQVSSDPEVMAVPKVPSHYSMMHRNELVAELFVERHWSSPDKVRSAEADRMFMDFGIELARAVHKGDKASIKRAEKLFNKFRKKYRAKALEEDVTLNVLSSTGKQAIRKDAAFEARHPRHPAGSPLGGKFLSRGNSSGAGPRLINWGWAKKSGDVDAMLSHKYPDTVFGFSKMNVESAIELGKQFETLADEYPQVAETFKYVGSLEEAPPAFQDTGFTSPKWWAFYDWDKRSMYFIDPWYGANTALTGLKAGLEKAGNKGFHPKGADTVASILTHEFGHAVDNYFRSLKENVEVQALSSKGEEVDMVADFSSLWHEQVLRRTEGVLREKCPSDYSLVSAEEFVAELFTEKHHTPDYLKRSKPVIRKAMDAMFRLAEAIRTKDRRLVEEASEEYDQLKLEEFEQSGTGGTSKWRHTLRVVGQQSWER